MKVAHLFVIAIFVSSCSGTKKAIETQPKLTREVAIATEPSKITEVQQPTHDDGEIYEMIEVVDNEGNTIAEVSSLEEAKNVIIPIPTVEHDTTFEYFDHSLWQELLSNNVTQNGNVNYVGFKNDNKKLKAYIDALAINLPIEEWNREDKLAYWINAYNALTIDLIIRNYPLNSIKNIKDPWDQRLWKFGDKWQNLNDIEHNILRKMDEPRIHFAIVCASESCPKLSNEAFTAENLETQLTNATKEFLSDTSKNEISQNSIKISKIFRWFKNDFEQNGSLIDFLNEYADVTISESAKKSFKDYSWELNN